MVRYLPKEGKKISSKVPNTANNPTKMPLRCPMKEILGNTTYLSTNIYGYIYTMTQLNNVKNKSY